MKRYDVTFRGITADELARIMAGAKDHLVGERTPEPEIVESAAPPRAGRPIVVLSSCEFRGIDEAGIRRAITRVWEEVAADRAASGAEKGA